MFNKILDVSLPIIAVGFMFYFDQMGMALGYLAAHVGILQMRIRA